VAFAPFALALGRAGVFPTGGPPRALWAGLALGQEQSARLAAQVGQALEPLGFAPLGFVPGNRPFSAHVTLGRVKAPAPGDDWTLVERCVAAERWPVVEVDCFVLWRSVLGPGGPQYSRLVAFKADKGPGLNG